MEEKPIKFQEGRLWKGSQKMKHPFGLDLEPIFFSSSATS
jgi:hypothetical protein